MKSSTMFYFNVFITCITCAVIVFGCTGCNEEQLTQATATVHGVKTGLSAVPDVVKGQPWYIITMIIADIVSSALAAYIAWKAQDKPASKGTKNGNN